MEDMIPREDGRLHFNHTKDAKHELKVLPVYKASRTKPSLNHFLQLYFFHILAKQYYQLGIKC